MEKSLEVLVKDSLANCLNRLIDWNNSEYECNNTSIIELAESAELISKILISHGISIKDKE